VTQDSWPSVEPPAPSTLPRVEDLPVVEQGFDQERVREAFDSFYRHLARLDTTLRALEAVDVFQAQAKELRKELRALRLGGWTQQPWQPYSAARVPPRAGLPEAVPRLAIEAVFIIAVAVGSYEAALRPLVLAGVMAVAVLIVGVVEWAASRERVAVPAPRPTAEPEPEPAVVEAPPVPLPPVVEEEWGSQAAALPEPEEETAIAEPQAPVPPEPDVTEEPEPEAEAEAPVEAEEPEPEPEPEREPEPAASASDGAERARWWKRRRAEDRAEELATQPRHVRVLPPESAGSAPGSQLLDPWEEDFDLSLDEPAASADEPLPEPTPNRP
jgi:hypothetical protein